VRTLFFVVSNHEAIFLALILPHVGAVIFQHNHCNYYWESQQPCAVDVECNPISNSRVMQSGQLLKARRSRRNKSIQLSTHTLDWIRMHAWLACGDENALGGIEAHITEIMYVLYIRERAEAERATESELPAVLASAANKTTEVCESANLY
jgi:hypothetical protein